jgi:enoyl-CoA hydratase/carnithine racemase
LPRVGCAEQLGVTGLDHAAHAVAPADARLADELGWAATADATAAIVASDDIREGMAAFFEKREPRWTGK